MKEAGDLEHCEEHFLEGNRKMTLKLNSKGKLIFSLE
jgi:hypothetical protein